MKSGISRELRMRSRGINREPKNCSQSLRLKMKLISKEKRMLLQQRLNLTNKLMKRFKKNEVSCASVRWVSRVRLKSMPRFHAVFPLRFLYLKLLRR